MSRKLLISLALSGCLVAGCKFLQSITGTTPQANPEAGKPVMIRSFSETSTVTAVQPSGSTLWVGTQRGLLKWDLLKSTYTLATSASGLPGDKVAAIAADGKGGVWVMAEKGVAHETAGKWQTFPAAPVGAFVSGMTQTDDGSLWAAGPEGLARLTVKTGWGRYLGDTQVTAMASWGNDVWIGTSGKGVLRVRGEQVEVFGPEQGCETDVVRGLAATPSGVMSIGEGPGGARMSFYDGKRFWSYKIDAPKGTVFEWIKLVGAKALIGAGTRVYSIERVATGEKPPAQGVVKMVASAAKPARTPITGSSRGDLPSANDPKMEEKAPLPAPKPAPAPAPAPAKAETKPADAKDAKGKPADGKDAKADAKPADAKDAKGKPADAKDAKPEAKTADAKDAKPEARPVVAKEPPKPAPAPAPAPAPEEPVQAPPSWSVAEWGPQLPEGVTCAGNDMTALFVGTRFLGAARVDDKQLTAFRTYDLSKDAERLSVACEDDNDCYVSTGTERAWHFDGKAFGKVQIDPEAGSKVLAILNPPKGPALAIHRGASDPILRLSSVSREGLWTPTGATELKVPAGVPDVTFAQFGPTGHLWLGMRYVDKDGDKVDYGAAEVDLDRGGVTYHRQAKGLGAGSKQLPNDIESAWFFSADDAWFGTRSGAVHAKGSELHIYTENDGLESEIIHDVIEGTDGLVWVATSHGIGRFDGAKWTFPHEGDVLRVKATSLARDRAGSVFVGATTGLIQCNIDHIEKLDPDKLLDNSVIDLAVDRRGRVWVLTEKGISIVDR